MNEPVKADAARTLKGRIVLILLLASFVLPFFIGSLAYKHGWYQGGKTNRGELINPPIAFSTLAVKNAEGGLLPVAATKDKWWLVYIMPAQCDSACHNRLFEMRQVVIAMGKNAERVRQVVIHTTTASAETDALMKAQFPDFLNVHADTPVLDTILAGVDKKATEAGKLYIMDPQGWIMLSFPPEANEKESVLKAENVLQDLKKLLGASRIG
jgi:cytochrome oxidase Cu insertion factor (SCO1/SenC/PrrC family)